MCPQCRSPLLAQLIPNVLIQNMISKVVVRCDADPKGSSEYITPNKPSNKARKINAEDTARGAAAKEQAGCKWTGPLASLKQHLKAGCDVVLRPCPIVGCKAEANRLNMAQHEKVCEFRPVDCEHCKKKFRGGTVAAHERDCPSRKTACTNAGCKELIAFALHDQHRVSVCPWEKIRCAVASCNHQYLRKDAKQHFQEEAMQHTLLLQQAHTAETALLKAKCITLESQVAALEKSAEELRVR